MTTLDLNFTKIEESFQQLQQLLDEEYSEDYSKIEELRKEDERLSAMQEALENLSGVSIAKVELLDNDDLSLLLRVKDCDVRTVIDQEKKLSSIEVIGAEFAWINASQILSDATKLPPPNDLRTALFLLIAAQTGRDTFQRDITRLKRNCIVSVVNPFVVKFVMKSGLALLVEGSAYYSNVLNSLKVIDITLPPSTSEQSTEAKIEEMKFDLNRRGFVSITALYEHLNTFYPC
eukprot:gene5078-5443_t